MGESAGDSTPRATPLPPRLAVGGLVSGGRYELLEPHGGVAGQAFWKARDKRLGRDVALTFVDPLPGEQPPGSATGVLDRTVALTAVYSDGLARVLDVIRGRAGGIVVAEWIPGRSLAATVESPDPDPAVGAVWGLSDAATRAHEKGLVLGLDSPDRLRLTEDGRAILAFPGVGSPADVTSDIRGLGAVMYALLTGKWPLPLPEGSDLHVPADGRPGAAPRDDDEVRDPTVVGSGVDAESAVLAMRSLDGSSVSSAATVRSMISDRVGSGTANAAGWDIPESGYPGSAVEAGARTRPRADTFAYPYSEPYAEPDQGTYKRRWQIMAGTGAVAVLVIAILGAWMLGGLSSSNNDTPLSQQLDAIERAARDSRAAQTTEATESEDSEDDSGETTAASPSTPVEVSTVTAWQPADSAGTAENSASAPNVADGDRSTAWATDTYRSQVGDGPSAYKPGIGLMLTLDGKQMTREVMVYAEDDDVQFEIRSASSATPSSLDETTLLGTGTVSGGTGTVSIDEASESEYLLVWFTRLGTTGPQAYSASITEVELSR
ncbi:protein kinase family protein [Dietzia alimentaria]|uniref:protein kinase family protein n=1 Tax=Dietzia alimentaria TaxID=665550 RepID=UPI000299EFFA|nr:protein kinase family protein [Dietzia alimentaria]